MRFGGKTPYCLAQWIEVWKIDLYKNPTRRDQSKRQNHVDNYGLHFDDYGERLMCSC